MQTALITLISGMIIIFAAQNSGPATVSFLLWEFEISFLWVTIAAVFSGVMLTHLFSAATAKRRARDHRNLELLNRRHRW